MTVKFITPTRMSLIDITSMGDSSKREDTTTIGQFDSGLKYSIALLLRNDVGIDIDVFGGKEDNGSWEEDFTENFTFDTYREVCSSTGKEKELIGVKKKTIYHGGAPMSPHDMREPRGIEEYYIKTGFAKNLGLNWELYMALRELWSNMLDEGGHISIDREEIEYGTIVRLEFDMDSPFYEIWGNRHLYINEKEPLYVVSNDLEILENNENWLRIYKQNILVYEDRKIPSRFAYNIKFGQIDERRILSNIYSVEGEILDKILYTDNREFLETIITENFTTEKNEFLSTRTSYSKATNLINEVATEVFNRCGNVKSYQWIVDGVKKRKDCVITGRIIESVEDSIWTYSSKVSIESETTQEKSLKTLVEGRFNFKVDVEIKRATLKGSKVIADKYNNCLIVDGGFSIDKDMSEFFVQYIDLTRKGNVVKELGNYITEILKR